MCFFKAKSINKIIIEFFAVVVDRCHDFLLAFSKYLINSNNKK
jgi:hypothetical protein